MSNTPTAIWTGKSAARYKYWVYQLGTSMKQVDGNYIYARSYQRADGNWYWKAIYIGEGNLSDRSDLDSHHRGDCIRINRATHFHAHTNASNKARLDEETDLRASHSTPCNRQ